MPTIKTRGPIHDTVTGYDFNVDKPLSRARAIRAKCLECQCGNAAEVRRCQMVDCTLWPYRSGHLSKTALSETNAVPAISDHCPTLDRAV